jgi:hypothetical protein
MKIYFDNLLPAESNLKDLQTNEGRDYWLVSKGTILKSKLSRIGYTLDTIENISEPGCYFIDLNADPVWWAGLAQGDNVPLKHVISCLPEHLCSLVRSKKVRLIFAADKEGGEMMNDHIDAFNATTKVMKERNLPAGSILILQGNMNIEDDYNKWLDHTGSDKMFEVQFSSHFTQMFYNKKFPEKIAIDTAIVSAQYDYNSLNRVYRPHRGAHLYFLVRNGLLFKGMVTCNELPTTDSYGAFLVDKDIDFFIKVLKDHYPRFIDGDWSKTNAAEAHNLDFYNNSLITVVTETKFEEKVVFPTEKIFKPIAFGHPLILLSSSGTLKKIRDMGFDTSWCGIDPAYNDIEDDKERFEETNNILKWWTALPRDKKIKKIIESRDSIMHNFNLIRSKDFYGESLKLAIENSEKYLND